jgi:hypothetical protein
MDLMDEEAFKKELQGLVATDLVYVVKEGGEEHTGLSKAGVDQCCTLLGQQGEAIREERLDYKIIGEGEEQVALFEVTAARYRVGKNPTGGMGEVKLDQTIGLKAQALYFDAAIPLSLDSRCPGKKANGRTFREMLQGDDGRGYLAWMADNFREEATREFVRRILNGEDTMIQPGRQKNPFWFEAGGMKAARNARQRLIPISVQAQVIAKAKEAGKAKVVDRGKQEGWAPRSQHSDGSAGNTGRSTPGQVSTAESITRETVYPFGKFKGKKLSELPVAYMQWATEIDDGGTLQHPFAPEDVILAWFHAFRAEIHLRALIENAGDTPLGTGDLIPVFNDQRRQSFISLQQQRDMADDAAPRP